MKIIIIGDGKVGYSLAEHLSQEDHDVTIIDKDPEALRKASESLDVMCVRGNGVSTRIMMEAGIKTADLLIAATSSDEMNMVCALTGKKLGAKHTVARIRDPEYANELSVLKAELGLDLVINPEQAASREIGRLLRFPPATDVEHFAKGRIEFIEIRTNHNMPIIGIPLKDLPSRIAGNILIGAVERGDEVIIPNGDFVIKSGDILYIVGKPSDITEFCKQIGLLTQKIKNVMVVGGGRVAHYLALLLRQIDMKVKIIEIDRERCIELSEMLPDALIINGDGTDQAFLESENLCDMDAFVALTGRDEENLISALLAKQCGVKKVIAKITRINNPAVYTVLGVDSIVNPKLITANYILRFVRGLNSALNNPANTVYKIINGKAEVLEFTATKSLRFLNIPLKNLRLVNGVIIGAIARKNEIIIPHGDDCVRLGDNVLVIAVNKRIVDLNEVIASVGGSK
ncbi:MAG TPA: Trk system potassium transporter TrkA [Clostridiaceae bacterium]|nr:Trk system potassium transporter TrkA [Clostridiaceae bacterium]